MSLSASAASSVPEICFGVLVKRIPGETSNFRPPQCKRVQYSDAPYICARTPFAAYSRFQDDDRSLESDRVPHTIGRAQSEERSPAQACPESRTWLWQGASALTGAR